RCPRRAARPAPLDGRLHSLRRHPPGRRRPRAERALRGPHPDSGPRLSPRDGARLVLQQGSEPRARDRQPRRERALHGASDRRHHRPMTLLRPGTSLSTHRGTMLRRTLVGLILLPLLLVPCGGSAYAQSSGPQVAGRVGPGAQDLLARPARLNVAEVTLYDALTELENRSGVSLVYSPSRLPLRARVSCACFGLSVDQALDRILAGTNLRHTIVGEHILIESVEAPTPHTTTDRI